MLKIFREKDSEQSNRLPELIRPMTPAKFVVPKFLNRTFIRKDVVERENEKLIKKIEKITQAASTGRLKARSKSPLRNNYQYLKNELTDRSHREERRQSHLDRVSPISIFPKKGGKESSVIEEVIMNRKNTVIDVLQRKASRLMI